MECLSPDRNGKLFEGENEFLKQKRSDSRSFLFAYKNSLKQENLEWIAGLASNLKQKERLV
jgi:hypothetical protein